MEIYVSSLNSCAGSPWWSSQTRQALPSFTVTAEMGSSGGHPGYLSLSDRLLANWFPWRHSIVANETHFMVASSFQQKTLILLRRRHILGFLYHSTGGLWEELFQNLDRGSLHLSCFTSRWHSALSLWLTPCCHRSRVRHWLVSLYHTFYYYLQNS